MASLSKTDSRRMYSWWWNSHISPKNSKWLQENLTDVDIKVKAMIKLIEEDADSFARRAEMYYKKRPELMKLVEEMYRAYRALAERYVHATGALRQAHKTMTEAFPNQVPVMGDDSSANSPYDGDPQTPDSRTFDPEDLQKFEDSDGSTVTARRSLKFSDSEDGSTKNRSRARPVSEFESDKEILLLKEALAKLEDEKEAGLKKYQESLERLSKLESEISHAQEASSELANRASKAETEALKLKDALQRLKDETHPNLELYHHGLERLAHLERLLIEQARESENVTRNLKEEIRVLKDERDAAYEQYKESIQIQSDLENKLAEAEKEVMMLRERAQKAESEVENLKGQIGKLTKEKEAQAKLYQQCLETISSLELRLVCAEEEAARLNNEINHGVSKLKGLEEQRLMLERSNETLQMDLESMVVKNTTQSQELTEKQKELGRLWTCIQEERLRFVEAETAFQTLQQLHSQSQEELRSLASELHHKAQILREIETRNQVLEREIQKQIEENRSLNEVNLSSSVSLKEMQSEIGSLKETNGKLGEELEIRVDERNALQQEIYCLKEEINELTKNQNLILTQFADVGLNPESFGSNVKELQVENSNLKEKWEMEKTEKADLLKKLEIMGQLLERNAVLENSLSDLGEELEGVRSKLKALEDSYQSLSKDKSTLDVEKANLLGQLQVTTENLTLVSEKNTVLENSLFDAHVKLEVLKQKSKSLEDSCQILSDEKSVLVTEKGILLSQMETTEKILKDLELKYTDLQSNYLSMEKERDSTLHKVEELHLSLALQNQEHLTFSQKNEKQLHNLKTQIQLLQEQNRNKSKEYEKEVDKTFGSEIEIFVLMNCVQDLEEQNVSLVNDCYKLQEAVNLSESLVNVLKQEKVESQVKIKSLTDQNDKLRSGMHELLKVAGISLNENKGEFFDVLQRKFEGTNSALMENENRNNELIVQISVLVTLLKQLKTAVADLEAEKGGIQRELGVRVEKIHELETEARKLSETNENLRSKVNEGDVAEERLKTELDNLHGELSVVQEAFKTLQKENSVVLEENESLLKDKVQMNEKIHLLEKENDSLFGEVLSQGILGHTLKKYLDEKHEENNRLSGDLQKLFVVNNVLVEKMSMVETKLEDSRTKNLRLKENLEKNERELGAVILVRDQLDADLVNGNNRLQIKEQEHEEAVQKLMILENEKMGLLEMVAALQRENHEVKTVKDEQGKQILELVQDNDNLKNSIIEKDEEINRLGEDLQKLLGVNNMLSGEISVVEKKLEEAKTENLHLKENLEKNERELGAVILVRNQLDADLVNGKNRLQIKEQEHEESVQKLMILENEKTGLLEILAGVQNEFKTVKDEQEKRILELLKDNDDLKNSIDEKDEEINRLGEDLQKLLGVNNLLSGEISVVEKKLEEAKTENLRVKENLEKYERDLGAVILVRDQLDADLVNENNRLQIKEQEHEEAVQKLMILENEKTGLLEMLTGVQNEFKKVKDEQGKQILELSKDNDDLKKAIDEKDEEVNRLSEDLQKLLGVNNLLSGEISVVEKKLEDSRTENLLLKESLEKNERELEAVILVRDRLDSELTNGNNQLHLKEQEHEQAVKEIMILENEKMGLLEKLSGVQNEVKTVRDEHGKQIVKFSQDNDDLKKSLDEKHEEVNRLGEDVQKLLAINNMLADEMGMVEKKLEESRTENLHLKENLEKSERELEAVTRSRDELDSKLVNGNNQLYLKEQEHEEAVQELMSLRNEKKELAVMLADLERENKEVKTKSDEERNQILKLEEYNEHLSQEQKLIREASQILEVKLLKLTEEHEKTKQQEETIRSELQKEKGKTRSLETEASEIYGDLQTSSLCQVLLEEKIRELTEVCLSLQEENSSKDLKTESLKEKTKNLESANEDLKTNLASYGLALESLRDSILSLENHTCIRTKLPENEEQTGGEESSSTMELQDLESKVKAIETAILEMQMLSVQEKLDSESRLESAMRQIEELSYQKNSRNKPKTKSEILEADIGILPKDIMLDHASECSSYGVSKRGIEGEIWETTDNKTGIIFKHHPTASDLSLDSEFEKPEKRSDDGNKRKVLERLNSDVLRLTNLQITIEDLKRKLEITGKSRRGKSMIECETLKGQLMEAESSIQKLYELNGKLVKHFESSNELGESEKRKKVSEQARRVSEKIGRLQLEVQKIQFVLLKLDDENDPKGKTRFLDTKKRVLLKDYLYGGGRTKATVSGRRKKSNFCACVEPSTKGD